MQMKEKNWEDWELVTSKKGRQYWHFKGDECNDAAITQMQSSFTFSKKLNANSADKVYRYLVNK